MTRPLTAYKVLTTEEMAALERDGEFRGSADDRADGFIHLSAADQVDATVTKHFAGREDLHLAAVDLAACGEQVRWEASRGGDEFPHLYAPLLLETLIAYGPLKRDDGGAIKPPVAG